MTTVGYGDETVHTVAGKVVASFYAIVATIAFAHAISEIASIPIKRRHRKHEEAVRAIAVPINTLLPHSTVLEA